MSEKNVKRLMIFFIIFLPLQYAVVGIVGAIKSEPWPAFVLPAFKSVFHKPKKTAVDQVKFYVKNKENDELKEISNEKIFDGLPKSQMAGFLRSHFFNYKTVSKFDLETRNWLEQRIIKLNTLEADSLYIKWKRLIIDNTQFPTSSYSTITLQQFSISLSSE